MKAVLYYKYGSPEVLEFGEIEKPIPKPNEVLIRVKNAAINPLDWHFMRGTPYLVRTRTGWLKPKQPILGVDVSGTIEAVGAEVTRFEPGDEVFGGTRTGALAEYTCAKQENLTLKPENISFAEAASVPIAGLTALQGLRDKGQIESGQKVLVNGASGGVGTFAIQIAKAFGAEVTGVCSTRNLEMVRNLGADHVIDYAQQDFIEHRAMYDMILDNVANRSLFDYPFAMKPTARYVMIGGEMKRMMQMAYVAPWISMRSKKKILSMLAKFTSQDLDHLAELLASKQIKPVIDREYSLQESADAIAYLEEGHARGKVAISVST